MKGSKVVLGVMLGAAAGAILGVLFAPDSGKNTRGKIKTKSGDTVDKLKSKFSDFVDSVTNQIEGAKDHAEDMVESGKAKANQFKSNVKKQLFIKRAFPLKKSIKCLPDKVKRQKAVEPGDDGFDAN